MGCVRLTLGNTTTHVCHTISLIKLSLHRDGGGDCPAVAATTTTVAAAAEARRSGSAA